MGRFPDSLIITEADTQESTWAIVEPFRYICNDGATITVPQGTTTDFASIPRLFWNLLSPMGKYGSAAVVHDYLYSTGLLSKVNADLIFLEGMKSLGVGWFTRTMMYKAVSWFGFAAWNGHRKQDIQAI